LEGALQDLVARHSGDVDAARDAEREKGDREIERLKEVAEDLREEKEWSKGEADARVALAGAICKVDYSEPVGPTEYAVLVLLFIAASAILGFSFFLLDLFLPAPAPYVHWANQIRGLSAFSAIFRDKGFIFGLSQLLLLCWVKWGRLTMVRVCAVLGGVAAVSSAVVHVLGSLGAERHMLKVVDSLDQLSNDIDMRADAMSLQKLKHNPHYVLVKYTHRKGLFWWMGQSTHILVASVEMVCQLTTPAIYGVGVPLKIAKERISMAPRSIHSVNIDRTLAVQGLHVVGDSQLVAYHIVASWYAARAHVPGFL